MVLRFPYDSTNCIRFKGYALSSVIKSEVKKGGIARDIIREAKSGYNVVVMGKRGLSGIKEFILGSVTQKVFNSAKDISVLVVD